jgi:hypothetical protein
MRDDVLAVQSLLLSSGGIFMGLLWLLLAQTLSLLLLQGIALRRWPR